MAIHVNVRIVGVFLGNKENISVKVDKTDPTPADVLTALSHKAYGGEIPNVSAFYYEPFMPAKGADLNRIFVQYEKAFESSITGIHYEPGIYTLSDQKDVNCNFDLVWQYYLFDKNDRYLITRGFNTPFSKFDANTSVVDGGTLIFRLVAVATGPTKSKRAVALIRNRYMGSVAV